jgi:hypothetical protein
MLIVKILLDLTTVYLAAGFLFAIIFVVKGIIKVDEMTRGSSWIFRVIIIPGTAVFWPLLLKRWISASKLKS